MGTPFSRIAPFGFVILAYAGVALQQMALPGVYMDSVNPDYLVVKVLNWHAEPIPAWVQPGNYLWHRFPLLVSLYHGSQQFWLGIPLYALFGTSVTGIRLTHATFALAVLAAVYLFLVHPGRLKPWAAAITCAVLALDPAFSYAFRTQSYITLAPSAWMFLALTALAKGCTAAPGHRRWFVMSGVLYGLAVVGYFVYFLFLPGVLLAVRIFNGRWRLPSRGWVALVSGVAIGTLTYSLGYLLILRDFGNVTAGLDYFRNAQASINVLGAPVGLDARWGALIENLTSVFENRYHHTLIFGEAAPAFGGEAKQVVLLAGAFLLWLTAEARRTSTAGLRCVVGLWFSFAITATLFGTRLSGHHFMVLVPVTYAALALGVKALRFETKSWVGVCVATVFSLALGSLNLLGQIGEAKVLSRTRGVGLYSDSINKLASDLDARERRPYSFFPDWGLMLPVTLLTGGRLGVNSEFSKGVALARLCAGQDVGVGLITGDRGQRFNEIQTVLAWNAPQISTYVQGDGTTTFEYGTFAGHVDAPACSAR